MDQKVQEPLTENLRVLPPHWLQSFSSVVLLTGSVPWRMHCRNREPHWHGARSFIVPDLRGKAELIIFSSSWQSFHFIYVPSIACHHPHILILDIHTSWKSLVFKEWWTGQMRILVQNYLVNTSNTIFFFKVRSDITRSYSSFFLCPSGLYSGCWVHSPLLNKGFQVTYLLPLYVSHLVSLQIGLKLIPFPSFSFFFFHKIKKIFSGSTPTYLFVYLLSYQVSIVYKCTRRHSVLCIPRKAVVPALRFQSDKSVSK